MSNQKLTLVLVTLFVFSFAVSANTCAKAAIIVSGDTNIVNPLDGFMIPLDVGNKQFFNNILNGGQNVIVQGPVGGGGTYPSVTDSANHLNDFYNSEGINSSILNATITGSSLAGVNLLVSILPNAPYSSAEITNLKGFLSSGGTIFFLGENGWNADFARQDAAINSDLIALNSNLRINNDYLVENNWVQVSGTQIVNDPLTTGVSTFTYGETASVSGWKPTFLYRL